MERDRGEEKERKRLIERFRWEETEGRRQRGEI